MNEKREKRLAQMKGDGEKMKMLRVKKTEKWNKKQGKMQYPAGIRTRVDHPQPSDITNALSGHSEMNLISSI